MKINKIYNQDCLETMKAMPDNFVDLVVTSPPYDDLRDYDQTNCEMPACLMFDVDKIAKRLFEVVKDGGVVVWVVGDMVRNGDQSGTSFKHALLFKEVGFKLFDTIIYLKDSGMVNRHRYTNVFEYMFVFTKGKLKTFNPLQQKSVYAGHKMGGRRRQKDGSFKERSNKPVNETYHRPNIWRYSTGFNKSTKDKIAYDHQAIYPEALASDHISSWSNEGDLVYDPFMGSGTTAKMAILLNRNWIGSEISEKYCQIANKRLKKYENKLL